MVPPERVPAVAVALVVVLASATAVNLSLALRGDPREAYPMASYQMFAYGVSPEVDEYSVVAVSDGQELVLPARLSMDAHRSLDPANARLLFAAVDDSFGRRCTVFHYRHTSPCDPPEGATEETPWSLPEGIAAAWDRVPQERLGLASPPDRLVFQRLTVDLSVPEGDAARVQAHRLFSYVPGQGPAVVPEA